MITITPATAKLSENMTQIFAASPADGVQWSISPSVGSISNGTYTAPASIPASMTVRISAMKESDSVLATVILVPQGLRIVPGRVSLHPKERQTFSAFLNGSLVEVDTWKLSPEIGKVDGSQYTAPDDIENGRTVSIHAVYSGLEAVVPVSLVPPPPSLWIKAFLGAYLTAVFFLTLLLVRIWPPAPHDAAILARAMDQAAVLQAEFSKATSAAGSNATAEAKIQADEARKKLEAKQSEVEKERTTLEESRRAPVKFTFIGDHSLEREIVLIWIVVLSGALGSFVYSAKSFVSFLGNDAFRSSWNAWYLMMPLIGAGLALIFYLVFRGGFLSAVASSADINPYGFAAMAALAGMFTKQATNKLDETFSTMFRTAKDRELKDKLPTGAPTSPPAR